MDSILVPPIMCSKRIQELLRCRASDRHEGIGPVMQVADMLSHNSAKYKSHKGVFYVFHQRPSEATIEMESTNTVAPEVQFVSCTVVALSRSGNTQVDSHTFLNLAVIHSSLTICPHTRAQKIDAATLLDCIISTGCLLEQDQIPSTLFTLLMSSPLYQQIRLSTTRIPIFDQRMGNPSYGIRGLGLLSTFIPAFIAPSVSITAFDQQGDWTLPEVTASKNLWASLGVQLQYHFILILSLDTSLHLAVPINYLPQPHSPISPSYPQSYQRSSSTSSDFLPSLSLSPEQSSRGNSSPDPLWDEDVFNTFSFSNLSRQSGCFLFYSKGINM